MVNGTNQSPSSNSSWQNRCWEGLTNPWVLSAGVILTSSAVGGAVGGLLGAAASVFFSSALLRNTGQQPQTLTYIPPESAANQTLASENCTEILKNLTRYCSTERETLANATALPIAAKKALANSTYANAVKAAQGRYSQCALEKAQSLNASSASNSSISECDVKTMQFLAQDAILQNPSNDTQGENSREFLQKLQNEHPEKVENATLNFNLEYSAEDLWVGESNITHSNLVESNWNKGNETLHNETFVHPDTNATMTTEFYTHFNPSNLTTTNHLVLIAPGRSESERIYKELVFDLNKQGIDALVLGFEGNRNGTGHSGHISDFYQAYVAPIIACVQHRNNMTGKSYDKVVLVGHSSGGNAAAQAVERSNSSDIAKALLVSPMMKINQPDAKLSVVSFAQNVYENLQSVKDFFGGSDKTAMNSIYAPGHKTRKPGEYSGNKYTYSKPRYEQIEQNDIQHPPSQPTLKWIQEATKATQFIQNIKEPKKGVYQIYTAGKEVVVNNRATYQFAKKTNASLTEFYFSEHVMLLETDCTRMPLVQDIVSFAQAGNSSINRLQLVQEQMKLLNPCVSKSPLRFNNLEERSPIISGIALGAAAGMGAGISIAFKKSCNKKEDLEKNEEENLELMQINTKG